MFQWIECRLEKKTGGRVEIVDILMLLRTMSKLVSWVEGVEKEAQRHEHGILWVTNTALGNPDIRNFSDRRETLDTGHCKVNRSDLSEDGCS